MNAQINKFGSSENLCCIFKINIAIFETLV